MLKQIDIKKSLEKDINSQFNIYKAAGSLKKQFVSSCNINYQGLFLGQIDFS